MTSEDLREEINIEMESMETTVRELVSLRTDVAGRLPTLREKTAAAAFLSDLYGGIENILKRISYYHNISLPMGDSWHIELFRRFCAHRTVRFPPCSTVHWRRSYPISANSDTLHDTDTVYGWIGIECAKESRLWKISTPDSGKRFFCIWRRFSQPVGARHAVPLHREGTFFSLSHRERVGVREIGG